MDRVVWITGAAGGLGSRLVSEFAAQNWKVVASYRSATDQIATESIWPMQVDVTIQSRVTEALDEILQRWNRVDILINNAGVSIDQLSWQINNDDWDKVVDTNLKGVFLCSKAVARSMIKQGGGADHQYYEFCSKKWASRVGELCSGKGRSHRLNSIAG